jgi:hypothetical protein
MTAPSFPTVDVKGRDVAVQRLNDAQLLLLAREARLAQRDSTERQRRLEAIGRIFDLLESAVIEDADREYLMDLTVKGKLDLGDLTGFISTFTQEDEEEEKPKVRRGRPPKRA